MTLLIFLFVKRLAPRYILNGICIGSCVGGGFAMLLFVGFLFTSDMDFSSGSVYLDKLIGGGLLQAMDGAPFRFGVLNDVRFLRTAVPAAVLLAVYYLNNIKWGLLFIRLVIAVLSAAAVLLLISAGQKQCVRICHAAWDADSPDGDETEELD